MAFVGRDAELSTLEHALASALGGNGSFALVSGEAGIGKTRLCDELSRSAAAKGFTIAWGRSWEDEGTPAFWPWLQALRALGLERSLASEPQPADGAQARFRLFDAVLAGLHEAAARAPLLLVLDDLHSADVSTLLLLGFVARGLRGARVLLLGTARDSSSEALAKAAREALEVPLARLERDDLMQWVAAAAPKLAARVDAVFATSEGNPLFVEELLATARKRPESALGVGHPLPAGVRGAVRAHLATLTERAQWLLEAASVLGRDFAQSTLLALASDPNSRTLIDEALAAQVLLDAGEGRLRFSHVLLRDELYANIAPDRAKELHRSAAALLSGAAAVHHLLAGARAADAAETARQVLAEVRAAVARLAFEDAALLGQRALDVLKLGPRDEADLWFAIAEARMLAGLVGPGREACAKVAAIGEQLGDPELVGRAAQVATTELTFGRDDEAIALLRRATAMLPPGDSTLAAQLMGRLAVALAGGAPGEAEEHLRLRRESLAMARRLHDERTLLTTVGFAAYFPESVPRAERLGLFSEAIALAQRLNQVPKVAAMFGWQMTCHLEQGDLAGAERAIDQAAKLLADFPQPHYRWRVPLLQAGYANLQGRFDEADQLGREALASCEEHGVIEGLMHYATHRMTAAYNRGDGGDIERHVPMFKRLLSRQPMADIFFSIFEAWLDQPARVSASLARLRHVALETVPGPGVLAWACVQVGAAEHAAFFYDFLEPRMRDVPIMFGPGGMSSMGPNALLLGRLCSLLGRTSDAAAWYEKSLAFAKSIDARPYVAHTHLAWARLLGPGPEGRGHAVSALEVARSLGMKKIGAEAEALVGAQIAAPVPAGVLSVSREGEMWAIAAGSRRVLLKDAKGLAYLEVLVRDPHRDVHVLELVGAEDEAGSDAGPLLDARAKAEYRARVESLRGELDEAQRAGDTGRAAAMRAELDALADELSRAVGLGGRDRRAASVAERARINVQRRVRDIVRRVTEQDPMLGRHLELSVRTGQTCVYAPTWPS